MVDMKGKWDLITGASRGIGKLSALYRHVPDTRTT